MKGVEKMKTINKRFPADTKIYTERDEKGELIKTTFLQNKKINGELYAFLQTYSYPNEEKETVVTKSNLPNQTKICEAIGIKSRSTLRTHLNELIKRGYVVDCGSTYHLPNIEEIWIDIPLDTVKFLNDTLKEQVIKVYIYLGQRWKYKPLYTFTIKEIAEHLGLPLNGNKRNYEVINNCLICLKNNELIDYADFYEGDKPKKRLTNFSLTHKK